MQSFKQYLLEQNKEELPLSFLNQYNNRWLGADPAHDKPYPPRYRISNKDLLIINDYIKQKYGDDALIVSQADNIKNKGEETSYYFLIKRTHPDAKLFEKDVDVEYPELKQQHIKEILDYMEKHEANVKGKDWWYLYAGQGNEYDAEADSQYYKWEHPVNQSKGSQEMFGNIIRAI
jgi:hypothetical protein